MMNNMECVNRILDAYEQFSTMKIKQCEEGLNNSDIRKAANSNIKRSNDFMLKISYALSMVGKFLLVACLKDDGGFVSFDTYKYYKEKNNSESIKESDSHGKVFKEYIAKLKKFVETYNEILLLVTEIRKYVETNGCDLFLKTFVSYNNEQNKFLSLFKTCDYLGIKVGTYRNMFDNLSDKNLSLSVKIDNIIFEYNNRLKKK